MFAPRRMAMKDWKFAALLAFILVVIVPLFYSVLPVTELEKESEKGYPLLPPVAPPKNVKDATLIPAPGWSRRYSCSPASQILRAVFLLICAIAFYMVGRKTQKQTHSIAVELAQHIWRKMKMERERGEKE